VLLRNEDLEPLERHVNSYESSLIVVWSVIDTDGLNGNVQSGSCSREPKRLFEVGDIVDRVDIRGDPGDTIGEGCRRSSDQDETPRSR
jgi:hypothetical protein